MSKTLYVLAALILFISNSTAICQTVKFSGASPKTNITITVEDSSISDILLAIGNEYQFDIDGAEQLNSNRKFSITFTGSLETILLRLLRNNNHLIVSSASNIAGIKRIVILKERTGGNENQPDEDNSFLPSFTRTPQQ